MKLAGTGKGARATRKESVYKSTKYKIALKDLHLCSVTHTVRGKRSFFLCSCKNVLSHIILDVDVDDVEYKLYQKINVRSSCKRRENNFTDQRNLMYLDVLV
ncbi:unnamed protein product [Orchesella dallaii]|uniref:Uncharacterized protein n=1 Tax=Orchesella dallaii TaxID=48710 RepID=A0ABP1QMF2_9HEXA